MAKFHKERGASYHFPITHLSSPSIFETSSLMMGSVIKLAGVPFDTENPEVLNQYKQFWHQAILSLPEDFSVMVTVHRRKENKTLVGQYHQPLLKEIDQRYHQSFNQQSMFVNDIYLTVLSRGLTIRKLNKTVNWLSSLSSAAVKKSHDRQHQDQVKRLENTTRQLMASLSNFSPRILGCRDPIYQYSELLQFLSLFFNGGRQQAFLLPASFSYLASSIKQQESMNKLYPLGHIGTYLSRQRLFFSDYIEFQSRKKEASSYAAMLSIKRYPTQTTSVILDSLLHMDCEYISTNSFFMESKDKAQRLISRHRRKMQNVNDPAVSQIGALGLAQDHLASDRIVMGYHHNSLMLLSDDKEALAFKVANAIKCYSDSGIIAVEESIGQEPAFWSQIPGNAKMIARSAMITSENFVDFCPLHNYRTGYRDDNHLGSAVTILKTPSKTPYFFNFHAKGSADNPSKGHTTIIGGNGSGKTVTMAFLDAQLSRYGGRTFVFDRDRGLEIYLRACGGYYAILSPDHPDAIHFNPFQLSDTAVNRKFCREWMAQLIKAENEVVIPADLIDLLSQCVDYAFEDLKPKDRRLSNVVKLLPIRFSRWPQLRRWLRASGRHSEGEFAYLFDNISDDFSVQAKMGFDMTHFLDVESRHVLVALTMYLFHRLEQSFDGQLVTVLLDEGWQYLDNIYWQQKLKKWLPTLRKLNCHLVMATQSPASVVDSPIRNMILDNAATHIYFANPQAKRQHYCDGFNLTESEFLCVKNNHPASRYFLLKQEHESCLCQLDLSMMTDILPIFSANRATLLLQEKCRQSHGEDPHDWLQEFRKKLAEQ
jgi:type IV secretion system protein VirB4